MLIRKALPADLEPIVAIYNSVIEEGGFSADTTPYDLDSRREWFNSHRAKPYEMRVAEADGGVIGYCYLSPWRPGRAALSGVAEVSYYLAATHRGKGLGKQLLEQGIKLARRNRFHTVIAILLDTNKPSIGLLEKFDFATWGHMPDIARLKTSRCGQVVMGLKL